MRIGTIAWIAVLCVCVVCAGCNGPEAECCLAQTETVVVYDNDTIPASIGISPGAYTEVDGYRFANILVEFEQKAADEAPVSLGVMFAHSSAGKWGARRYFTFEENFAAPADPQMITVTGAGSWHGHPHDKSTYIARLPVMGPYLQVFPFNHHDEMRIFSIVVYLSD